MSSLAVALQPGAELSNRQIMDMFKCACEGGIRPANATNTIVLVVNHTKTASDDAWQDGIFNFTGAGSLGDQTLDKGRNKTLLQGLESGRPVYLFEVFKPKVYTYQGRVKLAKRPWQAEKPDREDKLRKVWIFPLERVV